MICSEELAGQQLSGRGLAKHLDRGANYAVTCVIYNYTGRTAALPSNPAPVSQPPRPAPVRCSSPVLLLHAVSANTERKPATSTYLTLSKT